MFFFLSLFDKLHVTIFILLTVWNLECLLETNYHHFLTDCQSFDGRLTTSDNFLLLLLLSPLPPSPFCWAKMIAPSSNAGSPSDDVTRTSDDVTRTSDNVCWKSCLGSNLSASSGCSLSFFAAFETFFNWRWKSCSDSRLKEIRHFN